MTTTIHFPTVESGSETSLAAYMLPMVIIAIACRIPPIKMEVRRPQWSARRTAGIVVAKIRRAEIPEARKEDDEVPRPALIKSVGAYYLI